MCFIGKVKTNVFGKHSHTLDCLLQQQCMQLNFWQLSRNADKCVNPGKLHAWLLSNSQGTVFTSTKSRSHTFTKKKYLYLWIGEQPCIQMGFWQFARNADVCVIPEKPSEFHLHAWLFSNPQGKVLKSTKSRGPICPILLQRKRTFPHGLDNNHACELISDNFQKFLENVQKSICMHGCSPIHEERS